MYKNKSYLIFLFLIIALAAFLRFWRLDQIPPSLWPDEAINANTAVRILETKNWQVFYPENQGREGLFFLLISFSFALFGISIWSFKFIPALAGILTILGQYLFSKELCCHLKLDEKKSSLISLLASFFLAISFWHINFSRLGFRVILMPLVLIFSFYFLLHGLRTKKIYHFILAGFIFGLGFYTYTTFRLAVLLLGFFLIFWLLIAWKEKWLKRYIVAVLFLLIVTALTAAPIGLYFLEHPQDFISRATGVSVFSQKNPFLSFLKSLGAHLIMFNLRGDLNWRHNFSGFPQLSPLAGVFFLIGLIWMLNQFIHLLKLKGKNTTHWIKISGLLFGFAWFASLLLPSCLTIEGVPHALRSMGVVPIVYFWSGLGAEFAYRWAKNKWQKPEKDYSKKIKIISSLVLIIMASFSFIFYFIIWAHQPALTDAFTQRFTDVGNELNALPPTIKKYVIQNEGDLPTEVPRFIQHSQGRNETIYLWPRDIEKIEFSAGDYIFIMNKNLEDLMPIINKYPNGQLYEKERILFYKIIQ
ncbi:MAG: ArnT family glycosyltransferase [Minisyncoccia bacterium]